MVGWDFALLNLLLFEEAQIALNIIKNGKRMWQ